MHPFTDDQRRLMIDAAQHYQQWISCQRELATYKGWMSWKTAKGNEYLYHGVGDGSSGTSLGRRSPETEAKYDAFTAGKADAQQHLDVIEKRLKERAPMLLSLKLGKLAHELARALRNFDVQQMLGPCLMVGGTHAILCYEVLAGQQLDGELAATEDLDFLWLLDREKTELVVQETDFKLLKHLKDADSTFSVNTERTFQARNAKGFAIDFLATSISEKSVPSERLRPLRIKGQSWLLLYPPIESVVIDSKGLPCRLLCPDPRLFAVHKYWVSLREDREPLKVNRDQKQSLTVAVLTEKYLPQYPFDDDFVNALPQELHEMWQTYIKPAIESSDTDPEDVRM